MRILSRPLTRTLTRSLPPSLPHSLSHSRQHTAPPQLTTHTPGHSSPCTNATNRDSSYYIACGPRQPEADSLTGGVSGVHVIVERGVCGESELCAQPTTSTDNTTHITLTPHHTTPLISHIPQDDTCFTRVNQPREDCACGGGASQLQLCLHHCSLHTPAHDHTVNQCNRHIALCHNDTTHTHTHCSHSTGKSARTATRARA
jgi:hypothetical protein